jgi:hypothetical protein
VLPKRAGGALFSFESLPIYQVEDAWGVAGWNITQTALLLDWPLERRKAVHLLCKAGLLSALLPLSGDARFNRPIGYLGIIV